eukprot:TRINITY_DN8851_c0_g2_i1.p1 TRINITY_DN8851_c0_g2~~TRINITY_DN8851_c0_g2_i1.p1  ORF type:complete len:421 (+),score=114.19 TRINITY_DN8851_c0_g2_i1:36-1298(+)
MTKTVAKGTHDKDVSDHRRHKVIVRRLPPSLTGDQFRSAIEGFASNLSWFNYEKGRARKEGNIHSVAYLSFVDEQDLYTFEERFQGHMFLDSKGAEYRAVVEYAPYQKTPKEANVDKRQNTIHEDPDFMAFLETLKERPEPLPSAEIQLDRLEPATDPNKSPILSPLILELRQRKLQKKAGKEPKESFRILTKGGPKRGESSASSTFAAPDVEMAESSRKTEDKKYKKEKKEKEYTSKKDRKKKDYDTATENIPTTDPVASKSSDLVFSVKVKDPSPKTVATVTEANAQSTTIVLKPSDKSSQSASANTAEGGSGGKSQAKKDKKVDANWQRTSLNKLLETGNITIQKKSDSQQSAPTSNTSKPPEFTIKVRSAQPQDTTTPQSNTTTPLSKTEQQKPSSSAKKAPAAVQYVVKTKTEGS